MTNEQEENLFDEEDVSSSLTTTAPVSDDTDVIIANKGFSAKPRKTFVQTHEKLRMNEEWPKDGKILTIEEIVPLPVKKDDTPVTNDKGAYYKKKLAIHFAESREVDIDGEKVVMKYKELIPSIFYGIVDNTITEPRIPKACSEDELDDNFTSTAAKMRYLFYKKYPKTDPDQSDFDYAESLKGKKVRVVKEIGSWKDSGIKKQYCKLQIAEFV